MFTSILAVLLWSANLLNAFLVWHQLQTIRRTKSAEGLSLVMMGGFLYMQVIFTIFGLSTRNWAMVTGMGLSAVCNVGVIILAMKYNRFIQLSGDLSQMLDNVERAFGIQSAMLRSNLEAKGITPAEFNHLVDLGLLVPDRKGDDPYYQFATESLRMRVVARRWRMWSS